MNYKEKYYKYKKKYLNLKRQDGEAYYHGSPNLIENTIEPRPSHVIDNEKAVFATKRKDISLIFSAKWSDRDFSFGSTNGVWFALEQYDNAFDRLKTSGYLYTVVGEFVSDSRLGLQGIEMISKKPVKIIDTERINNIYDKLKEMNTIRFIKHPKNVHELSFRDPPGHPLMMQIRTGKKTVEGRKNSEMYQKIKVGDLMRLKSNREITCLVEAIRKYPDIKTYLEHEMDRALPSVTDIDEGLKVYHTFISDEEISRLNKRYGNGFIAFEILYLYP